MESGDILHLFYQSNINKLPGDFKIPDEESRTPPHSKKLETIVDTYIISELHIKGL